VYFAGAATVLSRRKELDFHYMHFGKVLIEDSERESNLCQLLQEKRKKKEFTLPPHLLDLDSYMEKIEALAKINFID
jgi:Leucine-rich repeat (LRR) protein